MMGHTTESARFAGLLGLLVIAGLVGLVDKGAVVDSQPLKLQAGSEDSYELLPVQSVSNHSVAGGTVMLAVPTVIRAAHTDAILAIPLEPGRVQLQSEVSGSQSLENPGELHRLVFDPDAARWPEHQFSIVPDRSF